MAAGDGDSGHGTLLSAAIGHDPPGERDGSQSSRSSPADLDGWIRAYLVAFSPGR
ncbi:hypothetical protein trd_A0298 (plasmid) [Thermomicrobium roseum DSM 5159]|uniref:Uncharacterized protein n=1 Tax=Thermomicrobium roseum (strain ATCC 27502 / DSM 5159 / P-2) TaxID=309801 RepID=B9L3D4_THERP|nr:hypothetical protein trd_A0298 [Thermomicrobium roseum DSM 5159]